MTEASPWWTPHVHADRRPRLMARNRIAAALRGWFAERDFVEVTTAGLQVSPGNEAHLAAFATEAIGTDGARKPLYLHTSPEFSCKKLLAAGEKRLFSFGPVWRNRERGPLHHPEFTMVEWYRAGETYEALMADCGTFLKLAAERAGTKRFTFRGREADPFAEPEKLTVAEAFERHAGIDLLATVSAERRHPQRAGRRLGRPVQPRHGRAYRAQSRARSRDRAVRVSGFGSSPCPAQRPRSARG